MAVNLAKAPQIPREAGTPVHLATIGSVVHVGKTDAPFTIFTEFLRMAVPYITVEGDLEEGHGEDFCGFGVRAIELTAESHGDAVDEKSVEEHIADADEQDSVESAPGEDASAGC